jgi:hypothetical protein
MPFTSTLCEWETPRTVLRPYQGWPARRAHGLLPSSTRLNTRRRQPMPSMPFAQARFEPLAELKLAPLKACRSIKFCLGPNHAQKFQEKRRRTPMNFRVVVLSRPPRRTPWWIFAVPISPHVVQLSPLTEHYVEVLKSFFSSCCCSVRGNKTTRGNDTCIFSTPT